jgi:hypothetical protein
MKTLFSPVEQNVNLPELSTETLSSFREKALDILKKHAKNISDRGTGNYSLGTSESSSKKVYNAGRGEDVFRSVIKIGPLDSTGGSGPYPAQSSTPHALSLRKESRMLNFYGTSTDGQGKHLSIPGNGVSLLIQGENLVWIISDNSLASFLSGLVVIEFVP